MRVQKLLKRLKREFVKVNLLQASLDSLLFFLSLNLLLFLFSIQLTPSFPNHVTLAFFTLLFLIGDWAYRAKHYRLEIYEEKNPELDEVLRTARDNLGNQDIVSQALFDDLLNRAQKVTSESIIPDKKIIQKILAVGILSFLTVMSGITSFQIQETGGELLPSVEQVQDVFQGKEQKGFELKNSTKIYGSEQDINSSDLDIEFNITGSGEPGEEEEAGGGKQKELALDVTADSLDEDLELAKKYSIAIKTIS